VKRGMTQEQLGDRLVPSVTRASIANVEAGKQRLLVHTLIRVADVLNLDVAALLDAPAKPAGRETSSSPPALTRELQRKLEISAEALKDLVLKLDVSGGVAVVARRSSRRRQ